MIPTGKQVKVVKVDPIPCDGPPDCKRAGRLRQRLAQFVGQTGRVVSTTGNDLRIRFAHATGDVEEVFHRTEVALAA